MLKILEEGVAVHPKSNKILFRYDLLDNLLQLFKDSVERIMPEKMSKQESIKYGELANGFNFCLKQFKQNLEKEI